MIVLAARIPVNIAIVTPLPLNDRTRPAASFRRRAAGVPFRSHRRAASPPPDAGPAIGVLVHLIEPARDDFFQDSHHLRAVEESVEKLRINMLSCNIDCDVVAFRGNGTEFNLRLRW